MTRKLRIAAFGFRSLPPTKGAAGADKFALELLTRLANQGHSVSAYTRVYPGEQEETEHEYKGIKVIPFRTVSKKGFDTLVHSFKATMDIIINNRADVVHIQNGGNSIFASLLRLTGKKTFLSQDGPDWERPKWPWYAKLYLWLSSYITAYVHQQVIFDNVFAKQYFENRFRKQYVFIPFGADVQYEPKSEEILQELGLKSKDYLLFVGRFIPDKGLHYLVPAYEGVRTAKKLVLVGGSPNPSGYEANIRATSDTRVIFAGYVYGAKVHALMKNAYAYIQPSDVEGLSPVILESAFLGAPIICSDIEQNKFIMGGNAVYFRKGDMKHLQEQLQWAVNEETQLNEIAGRGQKTVQETYSWDEVVAQHVAIFEHSKAR